MENYKAGDIVKGKVTGIEDYGIFLLIDNDVTGLVHISEISDKFVRNVSDYATIGEIIKAVVIEYDEINKKLKLSIKNGNSNKKKRKSELIQESGTGFECLSSQLDAWIKNKEKEMSKK